MNTNTYQYKLQQIQQNIRTKTAEILANGKRCYALDRQNENQIRSSSSEDYRKHTVPRNLIIDDKRHAAKASQQESRKRYKLFKKQQYEVKQKQQPQLIMKRKIPNKPNSIPQISFQKKALVVLGNPQKVNTAIFSDCGNFEDRKNRFFQK